VDYIKRKVTMVSSTETREEWPLLTVETEANEDLKSTQQRKGVLPIGWYVGLFVPVQEVFFLRQSCRVACLLICVSGLFKHKCLIV
jgi:hypothetical protein